MIDIAQRAAETPKRKQREHGSGTLTEIRPKVWKLRAPGGTDRATGKYRQVSETFHATKAANRGGRGEAQAALRKLVADVKAGKHVGTAATFGTLATKYLEHVKRTLELESYQRYEINMRTSIVPALGEIKLASLTAYDLDHLYTELEGHLAPTTIVLIHGIISGALSQARKWGWITANVAGLATPPQPTAKKREPLSPDQIASLIECALVREHDEDLALLIYMLCLVGGRRGEACGFQWGDVNWELKTIKVERQLVPAAGGGHRVKPPKGGKERLEALGSAGIEILMAYQATMRKRMGPKWKPSPTGWLISADGGTTPIRAKGVTPAIKRLGEKVIDARGIPHPIDARPHDCRRFSVTQLIHAGVDPKTVRDRHGHSTVQMTERYMLTVPASDMEAAEVMGDLLLSAGALLVPDPADVL